MTFGASVMIVPLVRRLRPRAGPVRREQGVLAHQPQHPLARDPDAVHRPQPGPDLAMALAGPGRAREVGPDRRQQVLVGDGRLRPTARRARRGLGAVRPGLARGVERGPRHLPDAADARDTVAAAGGRGGRLGHHRDLLRAKGPGRLHAGPQQLVLHAQLADPLHGGGELAVGRVRLALFQRALERGFGLLPPLLELEHRQAELAGEQLGGLAAHQPQHHLALARRAPALAGRQRAQALSRSRPTGRPGLGTAWTGCARPR